MDVGSFIAALALGLFAGAVGRALVPRDAFRHLRGWRSWAASTIVGLIGAVVGYLVFTQLFGIGDDETFDWGGVVGAIVGAILVVAAVSAVVGRSRPDRSRAR